MRLKPKSKVKALTLRQIVSKLPCVCCPAIPPEDLSWIVENLEIAPRISDPHHVTSRGAGGKDDFRNLVSLCRTHHDEVEAPWGGLTQMIEKYPRLLIWLELANRQDVLDKHRP